jgi:predicted dehydrogenase
MTRWKDDRDTVVGVGLGQQMLSQHLRRAANDERAKLVGVVDIDESVATRVGNEYGVPWFTSAEEAFRRLRPKIVIDAAHASSRLTHFGLAARYGVRRAMLEKPPAFNAAEATQIRDLSSRFGCEARYLLKLQYAMAEQLLDLLESGELGPPLKALAWFERLHNIPPWDERVRAQLGGRGAWADLAVHPVSNLIRVLGNPALHAVELSAWMSQRNGFAPWDPAVEFDHHTHGRLQLGPVPVDVSIAWKLHGKSWAPPKKEAPRLRDETAGFKVWYERGTVTVPLPTQHNTLEELATIVPTVVIGKRRIDTSEWLPYSEAAAYDRQWNDAIEGKLPPVDAAAGLALQELIDYGYATALSNARAELRR